ncbi:glutamate--tRNA ligase, partial [candidate division KSB1 bacterium]
RTVGYSGRCRDLTQEQKSRYEREGRKPVIRLHVPDQTVVFHDLVQGELSVESSQIADFVIQREDGTSPYNLAVVVDDSLMKISHVIRGNDHVPNTPKQVLLNNAFGYDIPAFAHTPMIAGQDGARLSKRHGHTSVEEFRQEGYLPECLINFLSLLSWSSETGDEILSGTRLIEEFSFDRISRSPARFDRVKLNWMNGVYIRNLTAEERLTNAKPFLERAGMIEKERARLSKIVESVKDKVETFAEYPKYVELFFTEMVSITGENEIEIVQDEDSRKIFRLLIDELKKIEQLTVENFSNAMKNIQIQTGLKGKKLWMPVRIALTGQVHGPELPVVLEIYGRDKCITLLDKACAEGHGFRNSL